MRVVEKLNLEFIELDLSARKFFLEGVPVVLRNKEFSLLIYFLENVGRVVSRTQILEDVWDRNITCPTNTVDVHVSSLRQKFRLYANKDLIKTVHCIGYIFEL